MDYVPKYHAPRLISQLIPKYICIYGKLFGPNGDPNWNVICFGANGTWNPFPLKPTTPQPSYMYGKFVSGSIPPSLYVWQRRGRQIVCTFALASNREHTCTLYIMLMLLREPRCSRTYRVYRDHIWNMLSPPSTWTDIRSDGWMAKWIDCDIATDYVRDELSFWFVLWSGRWQTTKSRRPRTAFLSYIESRPTNHPFFSILMYFALIYKPNAFWRWIRFCRRHSIWWYSRRIIYHQRGALHTRKNPTECNGWRRIVCRIFCTRSSADMAIVSRDPRQVVLLANGIWAKTYMYRFTR